MNTITLIVLVMSVVLFNGVTSDIIVTTFDGKEIPMAGTELYFRGSPAMRITEPITADVTDNMTDSANKFWIHYSDMPVETNVMKAQQLGCKAVIVASFDIVGGRVQYRVNNNEAAASINITVVEVGVGSTGSTSGLIFLIALLQKNQIASITIIPSEEENPWTVATNSGWFYVWTVFLALFAATNIILSIIQLVKFHRYYGGCIQSIALYVLILQIISCALRLVIFIDPLGTRYIFSETVQSVFTQLWIPFFISSFLLFILYWHELMSKASIIVHPFITRMRVPFFIISGVLVAITSIAITLRLVEITESAALICVIIYLMLFLFVIIFYSITAVKLLLRLRESQQHKKTDRLKNTSIKILFTGGFLLVNVIMSIFYLLGTPFYPQALLGTYFLTYSVTNAASMIQILSFEVPSGQSSRSTGKRSAHKSASVENPTDSSMKHVSSQK